MHITLALVLKPTDHWPETLIAVKFLLEKMRLLNTGASMRSHVLLLFTEMQAHVGSKCRGAAQAVM